MEGGQGDIFWQACWPFTSLPSPTITLEPLLSPSVSNNYATVNPTARNTVSSKMQQGVYSVTAKINLTLFDATVSLFKNELNLRYKPQSQN